jgi:hypothetical protein
VTAPVGPREVKLLGDLASWEVLLVGGGTVHLAAHAYSREESEYVFVALAHATSSYEIKLARVPVELVESITGG